jgi:D-alanyl-D-alanine carboxypeptidase
VKASQIRSHNTNPTIGKYHYIVSKTGYINKAGGCIVAKVDNKIVVILGSKNVKTRIPELEHLLRL